MTTPTTDHPYVALPPGADESSGWIDQDHVHPETYRLVYCHRHNIAGLHLSVEGSAVQLADGGVDATVEPPNVNIICSPEMFSTSAARELATALVAVADKVDGWVQR